MKAKIGLCIFAASLAAALPHNGLCARLADRSFLSDDVIVQTASVGGERTYGFEGNNTLKFEVWLPDQTEYNDRYISVGNGGFAGSIDYSSMANMLNAGYAVGGCDSGHPQSENGETKPGSYVGFLNNPEKTRAWIQDSISMFTGHTKEITSAFYGRQPQNSYYYGCSTGGAQGFALAQLHPDLFDGIYAGSPGNYYAHLILSFLWNGIRSNNDGAFLSQDALKFITNAVLDSCDDLDGNTDRVLDDPTQCTFNISSLSCAEGQSPVANNATVCLTNAQLSNAQSFYSGPKDTRDGKAIYPGFALGSETEWMNQESSLYLEYATPIIQNLVFANLSYDYQSFNWGTDVDLVDIIAAPLIDEISPNLAAFKARGGKLIVTQGWADPYNAPSWPIEQRAKMQEFFGADLSTFYALFMIPGGGHCGAADSYPQVPAKYKVLDALVAWVEENQAPQSLLTTDPPDGSKTTKVLLPYA